MRKFKGNYVVIDCETGGLPSKDKKAFDNIALTELACVIVDSASLKIIDKKSWLVKPYKTDLIYDPQAAAATGIDKALCEREGLPIEIVFKEFREMLYNNRKDNAKPRFAGHNTDFDAPFIHNMFTFMKSEIDKYIDIDRYIDTLEWAHYAIPDSPNHKLGTCCTTLGIDLTNAHRALDDTLATAEMLIIFLKNMRGLGEASQVKKVENKFKFKF